MTYTVSAAGLALIQQHEGYRAEPAQLPDGNWVVGHGHVRVGEAGERVSFEEAASLLVQDLAPIEALVNARVSQPVTQSQFDALVSFALSIGAEAFEQSQVLRRVNAGEFVAAACAMEAWRKTDAGGESIVVDALVRRRAAEKALFLQDVAIEASPSAFMRAKLDYAASILGAPIQYAPAPVVGAIPVTAPQIEPTQRLAEILKSEPATEALLLTQPLAEDVQEDEGEIVTAHAKPVARPLDAVREATRRAYAEEHGQGSSNGFPLFNLFKREASNAGAPADADVKADRRIRDTREGDRGVSIEIAGLAALVVFGIGLSALGAMLALNEESDVVDVVGGAAVAGPGLLAAAIGAYGLWRGVPKMAHA
jgi:GH24 family phage-related lysozyme (muramidase)